MTKIKLLVVEDEAVIRRLLKAGVSHEHFEIIESENASEGLRTVATHNPDIILLDIGLPDFDGIEFIQRLREWSNVPVIVLSARGEEATKVKALETGANDYVTKPFSIAELVARINAALRSRTSTAKDITSVFEAQNLKIDFATREVFKNKESIHLTPIEYKLLSMLAQNSGRVLTHQQLLTEAWGKAYVGQNQYLRVFMKGLRHKLEEDPTNPKMIITESGVGYRFKVE